MSNPVFTLTASNLIAFPSQMSVTICLCLHGRWDSDYKIVMQTSCLVNIHHTSSPPDEFWDPCGCFGPLTPPGPRWPSRGWSSPGPCPSTTHSLLLTPLDPQPSGGSLCLWGTPDGSAPVCPRHSQQTESFTEHPQASQYLNHLKFKQWAQAVQLASLSETHSVGLTMSRQMGHILNVLKLH